MPTMLCIVSVAWLACGASALPFLTQSRESFVQIAERAAVDGMGQNPISKVTHMLEDLQSEMIDDRNIEQGLFDKYTCWYDTVMASKKASISEANDRIEALTSYIDDIESGRIEFSSEGAEATADVQELNEEIEKMDQRREKEHDDYTAAKEEMETAIGALETSLETLEQGTEGSLLDISQEPAFKQVVSLADAVLPKRDAALLSAVVTSGKIERKPDYKKLNKKNVHGQKYEMRSGKIQELVSDMLKTFKDNLEEANTKEEETKSTHEKLRETKDDQLQSAEDALAAMGGETASRDEAKAESQGEVDTLEDQVTDDKKIVEDTTSDYDRNRDNWKQRKKLMTLEIAAVSNALSILNSDAARDAMSGAFDDKKVFNTERAAGPNFLQIGSRRNGTASKTNRSAIAVNLTTKVASAKPVGTASSKKKKVALHAAANVLKSAVKVISKTEGATEHKKKIQKLVDMLRTRAQNEAQGEFDVVHKILNKQKQALMDEAEADMEKKEECETNLVEKTEGAQSSSNFMDEKTRFINRTEFEVEDLWDVVNKTVDEVEETEWELNDATVERADYHTAFLKEKAGLEAAISFIEQAKKALDKFYEDNSLGAHAFLQKQAKLQKRLGLHGGMKKAANPDMIVEAGKDPPPPPAISVGDYEGNEGNTGIQDIMSNIKDDVAHDLDKLTDTEADSKADYEQLKSDLENAVSNKMVFKGEKETEIADKLTEISNANSAKASEKVILDGVVLALKTLEPDCDYVFTTHAVRIRNRQLEADSVNDALELLDGSTTEVEFKEPDGAVSS